MLKNKGRFMKKAFSEIYVGRRVSIADPVRQCGNRLTIDAASKFQEYRYNQCKSAFTLAEVLITLMIIGIVAALTIPSVISNYQQQEFKTGLKKAVSVLNEAIQTNIAMDGETPYENSNLFYYLQKHMNVLDNNQGFSSSNFHSNIFFYTTDGMRYEFKGRSDDAFKLHETGTYISGSNPGKIQYREVGFCGSLGLLNNPNNTKTYPCIVMVDVNGDKKPNPVNTQYEYWANGNIKSAKAEPYIYPSPSDKKLTDVFNIMITDEKAIPFGVVAQRAMYSK